MAEETDKAAKPLGATLAPGSPYLDESDDMYDAPSEMAGDGLLPRALRILAGICRPYWLANHEAIKLQSAHRRITRKALIAATLAVTIAIIQLPLLPYLTGWKKDAAAFIEFLAALYALIYVVRGLRLAVQKRWLLERHRAESYRFLKFRWLLDLATKTKEDRDLKEWSRLASAEYAAISRMEEPQLQKWIKENHRVAKDVKPLQSAISESELNALVAYYKKKRLDRQVQYFFTKWDATLKDDWLTKMIPTYLFLASLGIALAHFGIDIGDVLAGWFKQSEVTWGKNYGVYMITAAALLPVLGASFRTHRSANEYSRNTVRFHAVYKELGDAAENILSLPEATAKLRMLWQCEETLEDEHREWLRLMDEAEWYG